MTAWVLVIVVVALVSTIIGIAAYLRGGASIHTLGRRGTTWMEHSEDTPVQDRPSEDEQDAPIPRRPLRARH